MSRKSHTAAKFTKAAADWSNTEFRDSGEYLKKRANLVLHWGTPLEAGDRVLELGCGDGAFCLVLARLGLRVTGMDIAPGMIEVAQARAAREGLDIDFRIGDADSLDYEESFEAVVSFMRAFFWYLDDPAGVLERLRSRTTKKLIVDWNHNSKLSPLEAVRAVEAAGFTEAAWRPWFDPNPRKPMPARDLRLRRWLEDHALLSMVPLMLRRFHFEIHIEGEVRASGARGQVIGHRPDRSLLQRSLLRLGGMLPRDRRDP